MDTGAEFARVQILHYTRYMPTIKRFGRIKITMYGGDHNPPHVHVIGPDFAAQIAIPHGDILNGAFPVKNWRAILRWVADNRGMLMELWKCLTSQE